MGEFTGRSAGSIGDAYEGGREFFEFGNCRVECAGRFFRFGREELERESGFVTGEDFVDMHWKRVEIIESSE